MIRPRNLIDDFCDAPPRAPESAEVFLRGEMQKTISACHFVIPAQAEFGRSNDERAKSESPQPLVSAE